MWRAGKSRVHMIVNAARQGMRHGHACHTELLVKSGISRGKRIERCRLQY
jgi:hypothetical protein